MTLSIFSCVCWPSGWLLWRNVYLGLLSSFWLDFFFLIKLHELLVYFGIYSLSGASFANIFSHFEDSFLLWFPLLHKTFKFRSHLFMFAFIFITLRNGSKKILLKFVPYDPAIAFLGIYLEKTIIRKHTCIPMFTTALFTKSGHGSNLNVHQKKKW